jgi:hypothetical protein
MKVSVARSAWRPLAYALAAIPMVLLAVDMTIAHRFFPEPDSTPVVVTTETLVDGSTSEITEDVLTLDGKAQQRRERVLGAALFAAGAAAAIWGLKDLLAPRRIITIDADGLTLRVGAWTRQVRRHAWSEIAGVRSGVVEDGAGPLPVLSLRFVDESVLPADPWGAVVHPPWLHLLTQEWDRPAHEVAPMIELQINRARRAVLEE